ncbi:MAG: HK97 family phage prohead protease [Eubacteriales bacterium]|nr:HK97 family phage prohead protease [Eubacteriales bacterium]
MQKKSKAETINRSYFEPTGFRSVDGEGNERKFELTFSSEEPYKRWFGDEVLDHSEGCGNLERLNSIGCLLFNHNRDDVVGKILRAWISDGKGHAEVEFDTDERSEIIYQKVKNGTLKATSFAYRVGVWEDVKAGENSSDGRFKGPISIAKSWTAMEISIVTVPADATVGVGRNEQKEENPLDWYEKQIQVNKNKMGGF